MAIQMRQGAYADFDPSKMRAGEWAVSTDSDTLKQQIWMCFAPGVVKRIGTIEDFDVEIKILFQSYMDDISNSVNTARGYADTATTQADNASNSATKAKTSETNAKTSETNAKASETKASTSASNASASATKASTSETNAKTSETNASAYASNAKTSENSATASKTASATSEANAKKYADQAKASATNASTSATNASASASNAKTSETNAKTSEGNSALSEQEAQKYAEQAKSISESLSGTLRPLGTINFADLPSTADATSGDMYNILDQFTTTTDFKEGSGNIIPAGSNVYLTIDRMWDVLAGTPVTGVKGNAETLYRRGNVNITPANIGALATNGDASNATAKFTTATSRANIATDEKMSVIFGKIAKWFADIKGHAFKDTVSNLTTTDTGSALDASQGKVLKESVDKITNDISHGYTKNLVTYKSASGLVSNGITWTINDDGSVTANGTATPNAAVFLLNSFVVPAGTYTISGSPNVKGCSIQLAATDDWAMQSIAGTSKTITYNDEVNYTYCRLLVEKGTTVDNARFYPMFERGSVAHDYVQYVPNFTTDDLNRLNILDNPIAICTTGRATAAKVATLANFALAVGKTVAVKFTDTAGTANPTSGNLTLNVNGTGAKNIGYFRNGSKAALTYASGWAFYNNATHIFVYDGSYWLCLDWNADNNTTYTGATLKTGADKTGTGTTVTSTIAKNTTADNAIGTLLNNDVALNTAIGTTDISAIGDGTLKGAVSTLNNNLANKDSKLIEITSNVLGTNNISLQKSGNIVSLAVGLNLVKSVKAGDTLFTLPSGFRPSKAKTSYLIDINGYHQPVCVSINTEGVVRLGITNVSDYSNTWLYLDTTFITD